MKVLLVSASPRREGNTFTALSEVAKTLNQEGIETEIIEIGSKPIGGCIACNWCKQHPEEHHCAFNNDMVNTISAKALEADAFVFGAPVYYGQPNGSAVSLIQRLLYSNGAAFSYKPVASVCVCRRIVTSQYWNIAYGREPGQASQDVEGMQTMRTMAHNMAWMLKKFHGEPTSERPEKEPWTPMAFIR